MKKAFSTVACMEADYHQVIDYALQTGQNGIEIRMDDNGYLFGLNREEIPAMVDEMHKNNLEIVDIGTSICVGRYQSELIVKAVECLKLANMVGAKGIRIFPGSWYDKVNHCYSAADQDGMVRFFKELCEHAKQWNVEVWIETHNDYSEGKILKELLDAVDAPNLKIIWDIIHPIECGETPEETIAYLGNRIAHVHIKDGQYNQNDNSVEYRYTKPGEGTLPLKEILELLYKIGYDGYCSVEWESVWRKEIADIYDNVVAMLEDFSKWMKIGDFDV